MRRSVATPRRWLGVATAVVVLAFVAIVGGVWLSQAADERALDQCTATPPGQSLPAPVVRTEWEWWPPGHVCIYTDERGRIVARQRP